MFATFKKLLLVGLLITSVGVILFAGAFLQEFHKKDIETRLPGLGLKLPLKEPRIEVSVYRFCLELFDGDTLVKRYEAGFGKAPVSGRIGRDLASTPMGEYKIIRKEIRKDLMARGSRFLVLDYPNSGDARRGLETGTLPRDEYYQILGAEEAGATPPTNTMFGGPLGIQGNFFFFRERHFTDGSVALANSDVNELFDYVPVGTPVVIKD
jgi:hypothetical protein